MRAGLGLYLKNKGFDLVCFGVLWEVLLIDFLECGGILEHLLILTTRFGPNAPMFPKPNLQSRFVKSLNVHCVNWNAHFLDLIKIIL